MECILRWLIKDDRLECVVDVAVGVAIASRLATAIGEHRGG